MTAGLNYEEYNAMGFDAFKQALFKDISWDCSPTAPHCYITLETAATLTQEDFDACFNLIEYTSKADYKSSTTRWRPAAKKAEMKLADMRYLLVRDTASPEVLGFASFMLTIENGKQVVYLYEIHLTDKIRGLGIGKQLINLVSHAGLNAGMEKIMLTVFVSNSQASEWYARLGFALDEFWPTPKQLRNGIVKQVDYRILSRKLKQEGLSDRLGSAVRKH